MHLHEIAPRIGSITLIEWAETHHNDLLTEEDSKEVLKQAVERVKKYPDEISNPKEELKKQEEKLRDAGVKESILKKFFGFFKKHPILTAVAITALLALAPFGAGVIGKLTMALSRIVNLALSGLYVGELLKKDKTDKKD